MPISSLFPSCTCGKGICEICPPFFGPMLGESDGEEEMPLGTLGRHTCTDTATQKGGKRKDVAFHTKRGKEKSFRKGIRISRGKSVAQFPVLEIPIKDQQLKQSPPPPPPPLPPVSNFQLVRSDEEISRRRKIFSPDPFDFTQSEKCLRKKNSWGIRRGAKKYTSFFFPFLAGKLE